jgi:hypothetical protein
MNVNWLIVISNIAFGLISTYLCVLGWNTLKAIKYLNVGKLFWIPIFLSSVLFAVASLITILNDVFLSLTAAFEIEQITQLIALCFLSVGIFSYSKIIRRNIPGKDFNPEAHPIRKGTNTPYVAQKSFIDYEKESSHDSQNRTSSECNHQLGYLASFPANASLPEECMSCDKIIECKKQH